MCTSVESVQRLKDPSLQGRAGVLDAGAQTEHALQLWRPVQQLPIGQQLRGVTEHGGHVVDKLRDQTGVTVISLTEMI